MGKLLLTAFLLFLSTVVFGQRYSNANESRMNQYYQQGNPVLTFKQVTPEMWYYDVMSVTVYYTDGTELYIPRGEGESNLGIFYKEINDAINNKYLINKRVSEIYLEGIGTFYLTNSTESFNQYTIFYNNIYYPYYHNRVVYLQQIRINRPYRSRITNRHNRTRVGMVGNRNVRITPIRSSLRYKTPSRTRNGAGSARHFTNRNVRSNVSTNRNRNTSSRVSTTNRTQQRTTQRATQSRTPQRSTRNVSPNTSSRRNTSSTRGSRR